MAEKTEKKDPTVTSAKADGFAEGTHPAVPVEAGSDHASEKEYVENPDAGKTSVAQLEVREDEK